MDSNGKEHVDITAIFLHWLIFFSFLTSFAYFISFMLGDLNENVAQLMKLIFYNTLG